MSDWPDYTYPVDIVAQTITNLAVDIAAQSVGNLAVDIAGQSLGNLSVDIAAQSIGNINVNLAASDITLPINIQSTSVTVPISIESQAVDLNIKTSGGTNIVIDRLTAEAYTENRRTLSNNGTSASWASLGANDRAGKFFPRGCRGFIVNVKVYCQNSAPADLTITVYLSNAIGAGYIYSATITVPAGASPDWRTASFNVAWQYDSLFVYVAASDTDVGIGYDTDSPYDGYSSSDGGDSWTGQSRRYWFTVELYGQTVGDLPVSGTLNVVQVPHSAGRFDSGTVSVPATTERTVLTVHGSGYVARLFVQQEHSEMTVYVYADGNTADIFNATDLNSAGYTANTPGIQLLSYTAGGSCTIQYLIKVEFTRKLEIGVYNADSSAHNVRVWLTTNLVK